MPQHTPHTPATPPTLWYDYTLQAWVENGHIAKCGHRTPAPGCYACAHAHEPADPTHFTD